MLILKEQKKGYLKRFKEHIYLAIKKSEGCYALYNSIRKYGKENFECNLLEQCDINIIDQKEIDFIKKYNSIVPNGYNIQSGGRINKTHCLESKERMKNAKLGNKNPNYGKQRSSETKQKISMANSGENNGNYGKKLSYEDKVKLSKSRKKENLPLYLVYVKERPDRYNGDGYAIMNYPNQKNKFFVSKKMSLEEKYKKSIEYLNELNKSSSTTK
jgi:group I intron endonuclease